MAEARLSVEISASIDKLKTGLDQAKSEIQSFNNKVSSFTNSANSTLKTVGDKVFTKLNSDLRSAQANFELFGNELQANVGKLKAYKLALNDLTGAGFSPTSKQALSLAGNIEVLGAQVNKAQGEAILLKNAGKKGFDDLGNAVGTSTNFVTKGYSAIRKLAYILPGIGVAGIIGFATGPIIDYIISLDLLNQKLTDSQKESNSLSTAIGSTEYSKAIESVSNLTINLDLARKKLYDKTQVVQEYNKTIGIAAGKVTDLDGVEAGLIKNAKLYVQMTLYKAAAQLALADAAKRAVEGEQAKRKTGTETATKVDKFISALSAGGGNPATGIPNADLAYKNNVESSGVKRRTVLVNEAEKDRVLQLKIAADFQKQAAEISKKLGITLGVSDRDKESNKSTRNKLTGIDVEAINKEIGQRGVNITNLTKPIIEKLIKDSLGPITAVVPVPIKVDLVNPEVTSNSQLRLLKFLESLDDFNSKASQIVSGGIANTFAGIGEAIGAGLVNGNDVLASLGGALLSGIGSIAIELGKAAIAIGIGMIAIKAAFKTPFGAIAAGIALVAIGSAINATSKIVDGSNSGAGSKNGAKIPGFATGVTNFGGGLAMVGERGPELVNLPTGSNVLTNENTNRFIGSGNSGPSTIIPDVRISGQDILLVFNKALTQQGRRG
jgi:hypothetical protein